MLGTRYFRPRNVQKSGLLCGVIQVLLATSLS